MRPSSAGVVSYAGLDTLLTAAAGALSAPLPPRFQGFLPVFPEALVINMDYPHPPRCLHVAPGGFSLDPSEYHWKLWQTHPELYAGDNYRRNFNYEDRYVGNGAFVVDEAWAEFFPQYRPFRGDKLRVYLIGGGAQAVAVPESVYPRGGGVLRAAESRLRVTQRATLFAQYARGRVAAGEEYDAEAFAAEYLRTSGLSPVAFTSEEIARAGQSRLFAPFAPDAEEDAEDAEEMAEEEAEALPPEEPREAALDTPSPGTPSPIRVPPKPAQPRHGSPRRRKAKRK